MSPDVAGPIRPVVPHDLGKPKAGKRNYEALYCKKTLTQEFEASVGSAEKKAKLAVSDKMTKDSLAVVPAQPDNIVVIWG